MLSDDLRARVRARLDVDVEVGSTVVEGKPFVEIIRHARAHRAELVVLGRDGAASGNGAPQATAERVIRKGDVPVLLVGDVAEAPYQRTLVAVDLSDASHRVGELAMALLPDDVRTLRAIHAYHLAFEGWYAEQTIEEQRTREESARAALGRFEATFEPLGIACRGVLRKGDPRTTIVREVVNTRAELLVVGTHGRSGIAHALLGSVAEWLVRAAPCDVAVTRPARFTFELP